MKGVSGPSWSWSEASGHRYKRAAILGLGSRRAWGFTCVQSPGTLGSSQRKPSTPAAQNNKTQQRRADNLGFEGRFA